VLNVLPVRPQVRQPRSIIKLNGTEVTPVSWEVDTGTFYAADTFRCVLALGAMPSGFGLDFFATAGKVEVEIFAGFPADPGNYTASSLTSVFVGRTDDIDTVIGANVVTLSGRDLAGLLIDAKSSEKFVNQTASQVATTLAQKYGLTPVVTSTEGRVGRLYQSDHVRLQDEKTPWDLLTWLARELDFVVYVKGRELHFEPRPTGTGDPYVFQWTPGGTAGAQSAPSFNGARLGLTRSLTLAKDIRVTVKSWHSRKGKAFKAVASRTKKGSTDVQEYSYTFPGLTQDQGAATGEQDPRGTDPPRDEDRHRRSGGNHPGQGRHDQAHRDRIGLGPAVFPGQHLAQLQRHGWLRLAHRRQEPQRRFGDDPVSPRAAMQSHIRLQALMAQGVNSAVRLGLVSSYDPDNYAVKVRLQPSDTETGWISITALMAGAGFGVYFGPAIGDQAVMAFQEGSVEAGVCLGFLPSDTAQPPHVPSGEGLIQHKDGALLHFKPSGVVELVAPGGFKVTANTAVTGNLTVSGDVTDNFDGNTKTVKDLRDAYDAHHHSGVQSGSSLTGTTDHAV
jgi:phage baseplate assembly protein V